MSAEGEEAAAAAAGGAGSGLCWASLFSCLGLACSYVGSLYVWKSHLPRDHPAVIKRRFTSVLVVSTFSPLFIWVWKEVTGIKPDASLLTLMGFRLEGILPATLLPLLLTVILFLGPLIQLSMDCPWDMVDGLRVAFDPRFWVLCLTDMRWLRNQVIAPFTEELVFRACMVPMLVPCTGVGLAIVTVPVLLHRDLRSLHRVPLHPNRTPHWAGSLPLLLQLRRIPRGGRSPGALAVFPGGLLLPAGRGSLLPPPPPHDGPGFLWTPAHMLPLQTDLSRRRPPQLFLVLLTAQWHPCYEHTLVPHTLSGRSALCPSWFPDAVLLCSWEGQELPPFPERLLTSTPFAVGG
ncbi:hypothetical protein E2320_013808 [Naja naja]|nr:hypothetical protein E2320_013808 [Naja naja]